MAPRRVHWSGGGGGNGALAAAAAAAAIMVGLVLCILNLGVEAADPKCVKWGNTFDVSLVSGNIKRDCKLADGRPMCCAALLNATGYTADSRGVGLSFLPPDVWGAGKRAGRSILRLKCVTAKTYIASPLELKDYKMSEEIEALRKKVQALEAANYAGTEHSAAE